MGILMQIAFFILFLVGGMLLIGYLVLRIIFKNIKGAFKHLNKNTQKEDDGIIEADVIEVISEPEIDSSDEFTAAKALSLALSSSGKKVGSFQEECGSLANLTWNLSDRTTERELSKTLSTLKNLHSIFEKNPDGFGYTKTLLAKSLSGMDIRLTDDLDIPEDFMGGIRYAARQIQDYSLELASLANAMHKAQLPEQDTQKLLHNLERFRWLQLAYPEAELKNSDIIETMLQSLSHKLQMCANVMDYGIKSRESADLIETISETIIDLNKAIDTVLENALSWDLLKADVDLETLRRELRLRGL